ncbi:MAG: TadE/TadG family type IV pilus assembly protein [Candidatus Dormibacteria bacterium]
MHRKSRGQSIVEFSLVAPIFFALLFGIIACGVLFFQNSAVSDGAQGGAREALVETPLVQKPASGPYAGLNCESGSPRSITAATQQAANILALDPNPLCNLATPNPACNFTVGQEPNALSQTPVPGDATVCLLVTSGSLSSWTTIKISVVYDAHPLEPLLGNEITLRSASIVNVQDTSS